MKRRKKRKHSSKRHLKRKYKQRRQKSYKSRKKMPANVKKYFKLLNQGMSKAAARKEAGLPKKKGRKKWGPGHPLYDYQHRRR